MEIVVTDNDQTVPLLRKGELDLIFNNFPRPYEGTVMEPLFRDEVVVCASANHRLARRKRVTVADLARERWSMGGARNVWPERLLRAFQERGLPPPKIALRTRSLSTRLRVWGSTSLLGYATRRAIRESAPPFRLVELPVQELVSLRTIGVLYREGAYLSPAARRFIETLKKKMANDMAA